MFFLLRTAFWFGLVLLVMPITPPATDESGQPVGALQALLAARTAVADIRGICEREPEVCETGRAAIRTIGVRAKAAIDMFDGEDPGATPAEGIDPIKTGGTKPNS